jgi:hypothetical protein
MARSDSLLAALESMPRPACHSGTLTLQKTNTTVMSLSRCLVLLLVSLLLLTTFTPADAFEASIERLYDAEQYEVDEAVRPDAAAMGFVSVLASSAPIRTDPIPVVFVQSPPPSRAPPAR